MITPKEKAEALYSRIRTSIYYRGYPLEELHKTTKRLCDLITTEIMISKMVDLTDEQVIFWRQVQDEIIKL